MKTKGVKIQIDSVYNHMYYGKVTVVCIQNTSITFEYIGNGTKKENTQHREYFLHYCGVELLQAAILPYSLGETNFIKA